MKTRLHPATIVGLVILAYGLWTFHGFIHGTTIDRFAVWMAVGVACFGAFLMFPSLVERASKVVVTIAGAVRPSWGTRSTDVPIAAAPRGVKPGDPVVATAEPEGPTDEVKPSAGWVAGAGMMPLGLAAMIPGTAPRPKRADLITVARRFSFVRETNGANAGAWVQFMQRLAGGKVGDSWCADFVCLVLAICYYGRRPIINSGSTIELLADCRARGYVVDAPAVGDLCFSVRADGTPHHVALVTATQVLTTIAGNTSPDGRSSNGDGVHEHPVAGRFVFARLPLEVS